MYEAVYFWASEYSLNDLFVVYHSLFFVSTTLLLFYLHFTILGSLSSHAASPKLNPGRGADSVI